MNLLPNAGQSMAQAADKCAGCAVARLPERELRETQGRQQGVGLAFWCGMVPVRFL